MANVAPNPMAQALQSIVAPDYQTQQLQAQRRLEMAQQLQQMALQDTPGNGGAVSWTQGLARVADALVGASMARKSYKQLQGANQGYAAGMARMFGMQPPGQAPQMPQGAPPAQSGTPTPVPPQNAPQQAPLADNPAIAAASQGQPVAPPQAAPQPPSAPQPAPTGGAPSSGPFNLTGNPSQDFAMYAMNPDEYGKAIIASHAPTDLAKMMEQAGIDPNSPLGHQIMQQNLAKQNYIPPVQVRQGSVALGSDGKPVFYNPQMEKGMVPNFSADGTPTSASVLPGFAEGNAAIESLEKGAVANVQSHYGLTQRFNSQTGQMESVPVSGVLNNFYGKGQGTPTGAPLGQTQAANTAGANSANQFNDAVTAGQGAKNANFQLDRIMQAAQGLSTGPGSEGMSHIKSGINALSGAVGAGPVFDRDRIAQFDEMKKNAAALGLSLSQAAGQGTTDARLKTALDALPNSNYAPKAIQEVGLNLKGLQAAALARGNAAAAWQQQHGPGDFTTFSRSWNNAYNPEIFYHMQKGAGPYQAWVRSLSPAQADQITKQYRQMKALGAF